jgi:hypothetical protein
MSESGSTGHKPLFSQTFLGAVIVAVVGGILVWVVTDGLSKNSPPTSSSPTISTETDADTPQGVRGVSEVSNDGESAGGSQTAEIESPTDGETIQEPADTSSGGRVQTKQGYEFLLEKCAAEGEDINCYFLVTNKTGRPRLSIFRDDSWLNDQGNNRHEVWRVLESDGSMEFNILQLRIPTDSSVRFGLHFQERKKSVTSIKFLNLHITGDDLGWPDVEVE